MTARFDNWSTGKLGTMTQIARRRLDQARAAREAIGAMDRRLGESIDVDQPVRRAEDILALMRAELERRAIESCRERRELPRKGPEHRSDHLNREAAPETESINQLPTPIIGRAIAILA
jgi:hypothetical protein